MRCLACCMDERHPPSPSTPFIIGIAFGMRAPAIKQAEVLTSLCERHRQSFEMLAQHTESIVNGFDSIVSERHGFRGPPRKPR